MKVIVADDSRVMRSIIDRSIKPMGLETVHAGNGQEVLELLKTHAQDIGLILLDWNMPVMDGLEVLKSMRINDAYQDIPVLIISTESEADKMDKAFEAGAKGYLPKPFTPEKLVNLVRDTIQK
jgi:two-component system chemotaxis response regulator CheY